MNSLKTRSFIYYAYIVVNFIWYILIASVGLFAVTILTEHFFANILEGIKLNIPISPDQLSLDSSVDPAIIEIDSAQATLNASYIIENNYGLYIGLLTSIALGFGMLIFGFYQLRLILKSTKQDLVFNKENIKRLRIMAILLIIWEPMEFLVFIFLINPLANIIALQEFSLNVGFENYGNFIYGLLLFALAAVFEKGHEMYMDLKLTV